MAEKKYVSGTAFRRWVARMKDEFISNDNALAWNIDDTTYVYLRLKVGTAKRNPNDIL